MRGFVIKMLAAVALVGLTAGCACRTKKVDAADNLPVATAGTVMADVNFDFDSAELSSTAKGLLNSNAEYLRANPTVRVTIEGHCDERGTNEYNMALGFRRARSVESYMRNLGIEASRMGTVSYGEDLPLDPGHNESAWAKNRRAHFKIEGR